MSASVIIKYDCYKYTVRYYKKYIYPFTVCTRKTDQDSYKNYQYRADLIRNQREGKFIYYELNASVLEEIMLWITDLKGASDNEGNDTEK